MAATKCWTGCRLPASGTQEHLFLLPTSLLLYSVSLISLSFSRSNQHGKLKTGFFYSPLGSIIPEITKTHSQPNLLVTAKPLLAHRFSLRPRFPVQLLPAQMSPLMMFLIHTLLPSQRVSTACFLFGGWAKAPALSLNTCCVSGQIRLWSVPGLSGQAVLGWTDRSC